MSKPAVQNPVGNNCITTFWIFFILLYYIIIVFFVQGKYNFLYVYLENKKVKFFYFPTKKFDFHKKKTSKNCPEYPHIHKVIHTFFVVKARLWGLFHTKIRVVSSKFLLTIPPWNQCVFCTKKQKIFAQNFYL